MPEIAIPKRKRINSANISALGTINNFCCLASCSSGLFLFIAEEMGIKPAVLNKAIKIAHKAKFGEERDKFDELETILEAVGKTL